jgi:YegS/Rv2252/BmrU family lipid kinase
VSRPVLLLVNPAASGGRSREIATAARAELQLAGAEHRVVESRDLGHARDEAASAAAKGHMIAACGGDGFIGTVGGAVRNTDGALAVIPGGRGNDFARVLGIPTEPREAARLALNGNERLLDVATCDGKPWVAVSSFGFDSDANRIANETKVVKGNLVYLYAALKALWQWKAATFTVTIDGVRHEFRGYSVVIGNTKAYGGGMFVLPQAEPDDGKLDVMLSSEASKLHFLSSLPKVFKGTHVDDKSVTMLSGARIELAADRPFTIYADGDPIADVPATMQVEPRCLRVVVPSQP